MAASFKILVLGDGAVGKTTFIHRFLPEELSHKYITTASIDVSCIRVETTGGSVTLNIWDTAGQEKFGGLRDGVYIGTDATVLMFDVTSRASYKNIPRWYRDVARIAPEAPLSRGQQDRRDEPRSDGASVSCLVAQWALFALLLCRSRVLLFREVPLGVFFHICRHVIADCGIVVPKRAVRSKQVCFHRKKNMAYFEISALANYRVEVPLLHLIRRLTGDPSVSLLDNPPMKLKQPAAYVAADVDVQHTV